jgi:hypothetical protein
MLMPSIDRATMPASSREVHSVIMRAPAKVRRSMRPCSHDQKHVSTTFITAAEMHPKCTALHGTTQRALSPHEHVLGGHLASPAAEDTCSSVLGAAAHVAPLGTPVMVY